MDYSKFFKSKSKTPQTEPLSDDQVANHGGGYAYTVNMWQRLDRFLVLGSEGGSYYVTERNLTLDNAKVVATCLKEDGLRVVNQIIEVSDAGRAVRNDPAIFALALALKYNDGTEESVPVRQAAAEAVPKVCRTFTHLTTLAENIKPFGGWGRVTRRAFDNWYKGKDDDYLAYQMIKYRNRNGWTHRDILLKAHVKPQNEVRDALYHWASKGWDSVGMEPHEDKTLKRVWAFEKAKGSSDLKEVLSLIEEYRLPRECIPTEFLNEVSVWEALLQTMPLHAMIRNLGKMTSIGLLDNMSDSTKLVASRLRDEKYLKKARVHPLNLLNALRMYSKGAGFRGSLEWRPVPKITDALDDAFYKAFDFVEPTGKRLCLAIDVSGSMGWGSCAGLEGLTPREVSAALAMTVMRTEENYEIMGFTHDFIPLNLSPRQRLDDVIQTISRHDFGGTDCAKPMTWATENKLDFDAFFVFTDSETNYRGNIHPSEALKQYRKARNIEARLAVVAMASSSTTIADPKDPGMIDIVGCDTSVPTLLSEFVLGNI